MAIGLHYSMVTGTVALAGEPTRGMATVGELDEGVDEVTTAKVVALDALGEDVEDHEKALPRRPRRGCALEALDHLRMIGGLGLAMLGFFRWKRWL